MFDNYLIRADSLRNVVRDGEVTGFCMAVRIANYRGVYLSLHTGYFLNVDGRDFPRDQQAFTINGKPPRSFDDLRHAVWEHWDFDDEAALHGPCPGELAPGSHVIRFQQCVIAAYGYLSTDEEWVRSPPQTGTGAGSDKTPQVVAYHLQLQPDVELVA
mgnify:CR=1 FL=1